MVLVFFWDFSAENLSRIEVSKCVALVSLNWNFYREPFLMKNYKVDMRWCVPDQQIILFLAQIHLLLK